MNFQFYLEKLKNSEIFKEFIRENPSGFLCSGFFNIDLESETPDNKYNLDYYVPTEKKYFSFQINEEVKISPIERNDEKIPEKVSDECDFELDKIKEMILREMEWKKINSKIQKMLISLQNKEGKDFLLGTIFISGFGMIKTMIDLKERRITDFEKKSFFDMLNIVRK